MKETLGLIFPQPQFVFKNEVRKFNQGLFSKTPAYIRPLRT